MVKKNMEEKNNILKNIKKRALENHVPILQDETLQIILMILNIKKPNSILEIGSAVGYSAIQFSKTLSKENSQILSIELKEDMYNEAVKNVNDMGLENKIKFVNQDAREYLKKINEENEKFDVIFIDAAKGQYMVFLEHALRLIKQDGIIIADNVLFKGRTLGGYNEHRHRTATTRLREYLDTIENDNRLDSTLIQVGDGLAVSIFKN